VTKRHSAMSGLRLNTLECWYS